MATFKNAVKRNVSTVASTLFTSESDSTIILSLLVANTDGSVSQDITCLMKTGGTTNAALASTITVPADSNVDLISNKYILPSGKSLEVTASADNSLDIIASYVEV